MIRIENVEVHGFAPALRAMRNPMKSWQRSSPEKDRELLSGLIQKGPEHRKVLRMIVVWADITLPRFLWSEFDTYKVGVTASSESTMHKILARELTRDDFHIVDPFDSWELEKRIKYINTLIFEARQSDDQEEKEALRRRIKALLPESFLQKRTVCLNYETLRSIYSQRRDHRLPEWREVCAWIETLPESWMITL